MLVALVVQLCRVDASGAEVCHFTGASDYDGHVAVTTDVAAADSITRVDVAGTFEATTMFWLHIRYLIEEVSTWRNGELETVAVNSRYLVGDHIVRQRGTTLTVVRMAYRRTVYRERLSRTSAEITQASLSIGILRHLARLGLTTII